MPVVGHVLPVFDRHRRPPPRSASVASRPSRPPQPPIPLPLSVASPRLTPSAVSSGPRRSPSSIARSIALVERARRSVARDATTTCLVLNYFQIENPAPGGNGVQIDVGDRWQHRLFASTRRRPSHCRRNCPTTAGDGARTRTARGGGSLLLRLQQIGRACSPISLCLNRWSLPAGRVPESSTT